MKTAEISVQYIQHCGSDLMVANAARVSFDKESEWDWVNDPEDSIAAVPVLSERDAKLIRYLANHKHFSPFNHSFITVRVKAPVFVARQAVKHKFMPWNEISRRYVDFEPEFYFPDGWRAKSESVKQGSSEDFVDGLMYYANLGDGDVHGTPNDAAEYSTEVALGIYNRLLDRGVCAEQARMVLPQNMMTEWYWSGTLGAFCDMLRLRLDPHTQKESRDVAEKIRGVIEPLFPVSVPALLAIK